MSTDEYHRQPGGRANPDAASPAGFRRIITFGLQVAELYQLRQYESADLKLVNVDDPDTLIRQMASGDSGFVVFDSTLMGESATARVAEAAATRAVPLVFVMAFTPRASRHILTFARAGASPAIVLRGIDRMDRSIEKLMTGERATDAVFQIIRGLPTAWKERATALVTEAAAIGRRVCPVTAWAAARRDSVRSLERRIADCALPKPKRLLLSMLLLHTAWRVDVLGWPPKRAAGAAGLTSSRELRHRLQHALPQEAVPPFRRLRFSEAYGRFANTLLILPP